MPAGSAYTVGVGYTTYNNACCGGDLGVGKKRNADEQWQKRHNGYFLHTYGEVHVCNKIGLPPVQPAGDESHTPLI